MTNRNRGHGRDQQQIPVHNSSRTKTPTREDLSKVIETARDAATAAAGAAETALAAMEGQTLSPTKQPQQGLSPIQVPHTADDEAETPVSVPIPRARTRSIPPGTPLAFEQFMAALKTTLDRAGEMVTVSENSGWVILEGTFTKQRVLIAKSKTAVTRVASTLSPELIQGATPEDGNGRIASWLPPTIASVNEAIRILATGNETLRPPHRPTPQQ